MVTHVMRNKKSEKEKKLFAKNRIVCKSIEIVCENAKIFQLSFCAWSEQKHLIFKNRYFLVYFNNSLASMHNIKMGWVPKQT